MQRRAHVNKGFIAPGVANVELSEMTGVSHHAQESLFLCSRIAISESSQP